MTYPAAPAIPEELEKLLKRMRLPYLRKAAPDVLATARAQRWDPAEVSSAERSSLIKSSECFVSLFIL